jgi:hypothetical protein
VRKPRLVLGGALLALLLLPTAGAAGPFETSLLAKIAATLVEVEKTLRETNDVVTQTKERLAEVYPPDVIRGIERAVLDVRSITEEVQSLSCAWKFSPRVLRLWQGLFAGQKLCRNEWISLFGSPPPSPLSDLDEFYDYQGTKRLNMVGTRVQRGESQDAFLNWLLGEAERGRNPDGSGPASPGYSQRLSAIGSAALGNVLLEEGDTRTAELELRQERTNDLRYRKRLASELALDLYGQVAGVLPEKGN